MSIDQGGVAVSPKTSAATDNRTGKGKAGDAGDSPEGGFSSLLSAISLPVEPPAAEGEVSVQPSAIETSPKENVSLLAPALPMIPVDLARPIEISVGGGASVSEGLIADGKGLSAVNPAANSVDKFNRHSGIQDVASTNSALSDAVVAPGDLPLVAGNLVPTDVASSLDPKNQKLLQARRALGEDIRADVTNARLESRAVKAASELDLGSKDAMQAKLSLAGDFATRLLEPTERPRGKSFGVGGVSGAEAGWSQYAHHARTTTDMPTNLTAMVTTPAQAQVADKVSYWVTQGIQNAELKLDGFGADPVEVSILLKGGEAHVGFRSDQPEVRQMLEGALSQLKDSLEREGVILSGVTVGGSGADGGGRQQEQRRESSENRSGGVGQAPSESRILRAPTSVGRSLDIFV